MSFVVFLSRVFEHYGMDLEGETIASLHSFNKIEEVAYHRMGIVEKGAQWVYKRMKNT